MDGMIKLLEWDTDFFGCKIGKLIIHDEMEFDPSLFKQQAADEKYEVVYVFKLQNMLSWDKIIHTGLELVDNQVVLSKKFNQADYLQFEYDFRTELSASEKSYCYKIAEEISKVSRFYKENKFGIDKTKMLYRTWIDNAINQSFSDGLFLIKENNKVAGIHLIKTDEINRIGHCILIGVDQDKKGKKIGERLWNQSFGYWANDKSIDGCRVPVSMQNQASLNFHLKMGFNKIETIQFIYHYKR